MAGYDAVVVGSGHNALVAAAYLARAGWGVLVLEGNDRPGGLVRTDALTLPGFVHDNFSAAHPLFVAGPAYADLKSELDIEYLNSRYPTGVSLPDGASSVVSTDLDENVVEANRLSPGDGDALAEIFKEFGPAIETVFALCSADLTTPASAAAIQGLMHTPDGGFSDFAHMFTLSARNLLEQRFRSPVLRAMLAPWATHLGRAVDDANSGTWTILVLAALTMVGMPIPKGGSEELVKGLVRIVERNGGEVRCGQWVKHVLVEGGHAVGVRTADGDVIHARRAVIASVNPDQLYLRLLDHEHGVAPPTLRKQARDYRYGLGAVQVHLALSEPARFHDERLMHVGQPHLTGGLNAISRATNEALRGLLPVEPTISWDTPSTLDPSRCPPGRAVARLQMLEVPTVVRGDAAGTIPVGEHGWTEDVKNAFADRVIDEAARHVPGLKDIILDRHVISPRELAAFNPNCGPGDPFGGSHDLAQSYVFSPLPGQPSHRTVVPNLYMLGAATWPGHGINGGSGYIVAQELLD
ncbi:phytoene desaturase family protein [Kutzneria chonburiensis]|uniref:Pyridine nucleotide-disulfide oxidoreductase domain-containing protein 2 n=1 Tax=Kutzneria chonburiensis TaxID=1483604 RepID=A0ABV6MW25_9PSEU|nr:NAD(P)/FAD-dependent oxidoreductase [Kutzneria chonburiensis]